MTYPELLDRLAAAAPEVPPALWPAYLAENGVEQTAHLAEAPAYLKLLSAVYRVHRSGGGIHELLDLLQMAIDDRAGDVGAAVADWQEALSGDVRVVDTGIAIGGVEALVTLPPRPLAGLRGETRLGDGGGRPGAQFNNWSTWSVRELLRLGCGNPDGDPPEPGGWGNRGGFHPAFVRGGGGNQIAHFALALRLYVYHRLPYGALVGPVPPQDPGGSADAEVTTAAYWFAAGYTRRDGPLEEAQVIVPPHDVAALKEVLRRGLAAFHA
ncbi:MAG: hypothetical protein HPY64_05715 [Anaerolineae bacterium]|nr:hypothetical protein [Anaerolineae bacterium]